MFIFLQEIKRKEDIFQKQLELVTDLNDPQIKDTIFRKQLNQKIRYFAYSKPGQSEFYYSLDKEHQSKTVDMNHLQDLSEDM